MNYKTKANVKVKPTMSLRKNTSTVAQKVRQRQGKEVAEGIINDHPLIQKERAKIIKDMRKRKISDLAIFGYGGGKECWEIAKEVSSLQKISGVDINHYFPTIKKIIHQVRTNSSASVSFFKHDLNEYLELQEEVEAIYMSAIYHDLGNKRNILRTINNSSVKRVYLIEPLMPNSIGPNLPLANINSSLQNDSLPLEEREKMRISLLYRFYFEQWTKPLFLTNQSPENLENYCAGIAKALTSAVKQESEWFESLESIKKEFAKIGFELQNKVVENKRLQIQLSHLIFSRK
jgi:hypothetical protein